MSGWLTLAYLGGGLTVILGVATLTSARLARDIERGLSALGVMLGRGLAVTTLTPVYLLIFPLIRAFDRLARRDPMGRARAESMVTYWRAADDVTRVQAGVGRSFVTEPLRAQERGGWLTLFGLIILGVLGAEVSLRGFGFGDPVLYQGDVEYGYIPAPNQSVSRRGNRILINEWGMRAPEISAAKPSGVIRILILGDSTLWGGSYMEQDQIYARLLEENLNRKLAQSSTRVEVLNMGANGWGPEHKLGYLETFGHFEADIAIVAFPYSDLMRPISYLAMTPFYPAHSPPLLALQEVLYHLSWRVRSELIGRPSRAQKERALNRGINAYTKLAQALHQRGLELWFEMLPSRHSAERETSAREQRLVNLIEERLQSLSFPTRFHFANSELAHSFKQAQDQLNGEVTLYHDPGHLNARGHQAYARYLTQRLLNSPILKPLSDADSEE